MAKATIHLTRGSSPPASSMLWVRNLRPGAGLGSEALMELEIKRILHSRGRGFLTTADIHSLFRDFHQKWIEGGNYELCIEDVHDEIWDMVENVASVLIDVRGFWAHDNRENLLQEEEEEEEEEPPEEESQ
ncbi:Uncharacterized protein Rs2_32625 [Raphanus sativus]|nr:Uncharacterized protein Rs2_32625 [Raphanus sativus]